MAARYAVTTGNWTGAIWAATSGGAAGSAAVPTAADDVTINKNVTVTIDTTTPVALSVTLSVGTTGADVGGRLVNATAANSKITVEQGITSTGGTGAYTTEVALDMSASAAYTCEIVLNNSGGTGAGYGMALNGNFQLKGAVRKRCTTISSALTGQSTTSVNVADATGWAVGDQLVFSTTQAYAATAFSVTASSWAGGYLTCTVASTTGLVKGSHVVLAAMQTNLNALWTVYDVPSGTTFRIAMADPTVTDGVGTATLQPKTDVVTIATITPVSGTIATITWTDGVGAGGAVAYDHASGAPVGNLTSNLVIRPPSAGVIAWCKTSSTTAQMTAAANCTHVEFRNSASGSTFGNASFGLAQSTTYTVTCSNNSFNNYYTTGIYLSCRTTATRENNIFYGPNATTYAISAFDSLGTSQVGTDDYATFFRGLYAVDFKYPSQHLRYSNVSGMSASAGSPAGALAIGIVGTKIIGCKIYSNNSPVFARSKCEFISTDFGADCFAGATNATNILVSAAEVTLTDCKFPAGAVTSSTLTALPDTSITFKNKNGDAAVQEIYREHSASTPLVQREATTTTRSTSAVLITCNMPTVGEHSFDVLAKSGQTITIVGYVQKSSSPAYGASTLPKVTISGLGITPVVATMSGGTAADTWEKLTLSATNSGASDGLLTVTFTAQSATAGAQAFFAGVPVAPFVSRCRHYGYVFDETSPTRTVNAVVQEATEATAYAYTNIAVTGGTSSSSTTITVTDRTFQQLYDYGQAWACASPTNITYAVPFTGAGLAGNPSLFAGGNVTIGTGIKVNGAGSLSMGAYTLTTEFAGAVAYTYTGGTWSQLTTVPTLNGGQLNIGAAGTYTLTMAGSTIFSLTPAAPSTYVMGGSTFSGTVDLRNTTAHAITVELPSGTSYTTASNTGGVITVTTPALYQSVTISGITTTSRIQIYDTTHSTELYEGVPGATSYVWTDSVAAASSRAIRLRVADCVTTTAKEFIEASIGNCGTSSGNAAVSYLVTQANDTTYNTNAINGPSIYATSGITFTDAATDLVNCNIAGGSVTWPTIYACFVYWCSTSAGIKNDFTYISAPDTANYLLTSMKIKNISATPLTITSGYGRHATTGLVADIIDTAGSTGNIFPSPDHVVPFSTGSGLTAGQDATLTAAAAAAAAALTTQEFLALSEG